MIDLVKFIYLNILMIYKIFYFLILRFFKSLTLNFKKYIFLIDNGSNYTYNILVNKITIFV